MRVNVYSQELTKEVSIVEKVAADTGIKHYGVRLYLHSPDLLHHTKEDDDRSAVTFWVPNCDSYTALDLSHVFADMSRFAYAIAYNLTTAARGSREQAIGTTSSAVPDSLDAS
jgi:hypothetical protein